MRATYRNLRERLITAEYEAKKQELKCLDLEESLTERQTWREQSLAQKTWSDENQYMIEEHELQIQLEKMILYKMVHHITHLVKEVEKNK
jgi:hypothetical protein